MLKIFHVNGFECIVERGNNMSDMYGEGKGKGDFYKIIENENKYLYTSDSNDEFNWQGYDERLPDYEDFVISGFKLLCLEGTDNKVTRLSERSIPSYYPRLLKDFYQKCAPVRLIIGDLIFFRYDLAFDLADKSGESLLPIAFKGEIVKSSIKNLVYIGKDWNGYGYDPRVRLDIGNQKDQILGSNIFTFLSGLVNNVELP